MLEKEYFVANSFVLKRKNNVITGSATEKK